MESKLTQWHPAFCSAIHLELFENKFDLIYLSELGLNTKPIMLDLLVIKKMPDITINNDIGYIFKGHNIFDFKSPDDGLNIDTFYKGIAYACLYKSKGKTVDSIKAEDITISYVRKRKPKKLLKSLTNLGLNIWQTSKGIYRINFIPFDIQIIVTSELIPEDHIWLSSLTDDISRANAENLVHKMIKLRRYQICVMH